MGRILITGGAGLLGSQLVPRLSCCHAVRAVYRDHPVAGAQEQVRCDLADERTEIKDILAGFQPDCVIHCAAMTKVDYCQDHPREALAANAGCVQRMLAALPKRTRFIYISTDSVFDGQRGNYREEDLPVPLNVYARTKLAGEEYVRVRGGDHLIVRTNFFGVNALVPGTSFVEWIIGSLRRGETINMFTDVIFNPLYAATLAELLVELTGHSVKGTLNLGSLGPLSKYEFGCRLADRLGLDRSLIRPTSAGDTLFRAPRPRNTSLDCGRLQRLLGRVPSIDGEIGLFCDHFRKGSCHEHSHR